MSRRSVGNKTPEGGKQNDARKFAATILAGTVLAAASAAGALAQEKPQIAVLLFSRGFEFMVALDQGAQAEAEKLGVDITVLDGQSNSEVQTRQIEDLLVSGVDAIVISPANSEEIVPAVRRANEATPTKPGHPARGRAPGPERPPWWSVPCGAPPRRA